MMRAREIKVGIKTAGRPELRREGEFTCLDNMLIGDGFHWERTLKVLLPGTVEVLKEPEKENHITLINSLPLETYLECVVGSEMNPQAPPEFLKAHAVISRSWALDKVINPHGDAAKGSLETEERIVGWDDTEGHRGFHVCSDDHCQRYQGIQPVSDIALKAIRETAGEILVTPSGKIVDARFSKCCGGRTELFSTCWQGDNQECIESFDDPWCDLSGLTEKERRAVLSSILKDYDLQTRGYGFRWEETVSKPEIKENLKRRFNRDIGEITAIEAIHRGPSSRIDQLRIQGTNGRLELGKELWIRRLLSPTHLYSSAFEIEDSGERVRLKGRGWGHGAGLCQIGAANMALHSHTYRSILSFYYPGSRLIKEESFG